MPVKTKLILALVTSTITCGLWASDQVLKLQDGRKVVLHDDFTWQYTPSEALSDNSMAVESGISTSLVMNAVPVTPKSNIRAVRFQPDKDKNILQLSGSGVDVLLGAARYNNGQLSIPIGLTNQSTESVIKVIIKYKLMDDNRQVLDGGTTPVWASIKRMANTYLRPKTQHNGKEIVLIVPKNESYLLQAEIVEVETR